MSLLSDLLSKIKQPSQKKDVPPGLKSTVSSLKMKASHKKRIALLLIFVTVALGSGFVTVYLLELYIPRDIKQFAKDKRLDIETSEKGRYENSASNIQHYADTSKPRSSVTKQPSLVDEGAQIKKESFNEQLELDSQKKSVEITKDRKSEGNGDTERYKLQEKKMEKTVRQVSSKDQKTFRDLSQTVDDMKTQQEIRDTVNVEKAKADSSERDLYLYLARDYESRRDYPKAITSYKKVLTIEHGNYRIMNNIASILIRLNSPEEAKTYLQMAFNIKDDYVPALINMGIALAKLNKKEEAEKFLLRAQSLEPDNRYSLLNIATFYEKTGNFEKAREYYLKLKRLGDVQGNIGLKRINSMVRSK
jgi:Tfp pilus assembly protein PilF